MAADAENIQSLVDRYCQAALKKDADSLLALYDPDVLIFDLWDRISVRGMAGWESMVRGWLGGLGSETVHVSFEQVEERVDRDLAVVNALVRYQARDVAGTVLRQMLNRLTWSLARRAQGWRIIHQHTSIPIDPKTIAPKFSG